MTVKEYKELVDREIELREGQDFKIIVSAVNGVLAVARFEAARGTDDMPSTLCYSNVSVYAIKRLCEI